MAQESWLYFDQKSSEALRFPDIGMRVKLVDTSNNDKQEIHVKFNDGLGKRLNAVHFIRVHKGELAKRLEIIVDWCPQILIL